jgi:hypothetical protein
MVDQIVSFVESEYGLFLEVEVVPKEPINWTHKLIFFSAVVIASLVQPKVTHAVPVNPVPWHSLIIPTTCAETRGDAYLREIIDGLQSARQEGFNLDLNEEPPSLSSPSKREGFNLDLNDELSSLSSPSNSAVFFHTFDSKEKRFSIKSDPFFDDLVEEHKKQCRIGCDNSNCVRHFYLNKYRYEVKPCLSVRMPIEKEFAKKLICMEPNCSNLMLNVNKYQQKISTGLKCWEHSQEQMQRLNTFKITGRQCEVFNCRADASSFFDHCGICSFHKNTLCKCSHKIVPRGYLKFCSCVLLPEDTGDQSL